MRKLEKLPHADPGRSHLGMIRSHKADKRVHEQPLRMQRRPLEIGKEADGEIAAAFLKGILKILGRK
ncbi:hypothetical protein D8I24_2166 [Cupriavidus necator H850]|nr:hypothetical protein [Cupriavidus necator]KAI3606173.1 hypothetical protein D8I24_2166 [Cupriavidus necator H850]